MARKLASIEVIWNVEPIEGADRIECVSVLGWKCVAKKGEFKKGDQCVYFEIDSFLPIRPEFEFLRSTSYKKSDVMGEGFRLKTVSFKGQVSQGLCLPLSILDGTGWVGLPVGTGVADLLGVRKWEIAERATNAGTIIGTLPAEIRKTDETRVQAMPELIKEFHGMEYYISTKMDGSSHSCCLDREGNFHVTGHNYEYADDGKSGLYEYLKKRDIEQKLRDYVARYNLETITIQGEWCGEGIQKNRLRLRIPEWYVFTIDIDGRRVGLDKMEEICEELGLTMVPIEERGYNFDERYPTVEAVLARTVGNYKGAGQKEGIVVRPVIPVYSKLVEGSLSMKAVNNKYLLKND